ncbi:sensor histidine kinase, partial [Herbaspirillum frisingense]
MPAGTGGLLNIKNTIKRDLVILWAFIALIALVLAFLLLQLSRQGAASQISQATGQAAVSCTAMSAGLAHALSTHTSSPPSSSSSSSVLSTPQAPNADGLPARSLMQAVIDLSLRDQAGVEGGFWHPQQDVVAYAFPTYDGSGIKRDPPGAEMERIVSIAQRALDGAATVSDVRPG